MKPKFEWDMFFMTFMMTFCGGMLIALVYVSDSENPLISIIFSPWVAGSVGGLFFVLGSVGLTKMIFGLESQTDREDRESLETESGHQTNDDSTSTSQ